MKFPPLEIRVAESVTQAIGQLAALGTDARVLAGGQSLLPMLRYRIIRPHVLLDINRLASLRELTVNDDIRIGALVRHADLETFAGTGPPAIDLLRAHAKQIAFWPIRTRGTAVGSIVHADPKGDWPLAFFALDAQIELRSARGSRTLPVRQFVSGALETERQADELAIGLRILSPRARPRRWGRRKLMHRAGEYAMCAALALEYDSGWECWIGGAGSCPMRLSLLSQRLDASRPLPARKELVSLAIDELADQLPELSLPQLHRHAGNAADAALAAVQLPLAAMSDCE
jgi:CO/xanthine dehydrogenase FAD-binding subunit